LHMMVAVATGEPWFGRQTQQRNVLYVAAEGGDKVMVNRVRAVEQHFGYSPVTDHNFAIYPAPVVITDIEGMRFALDDMFDRTGVRYQVVVLDTMNLNLDNEDASSNSEMRHLIKAITELSEHTYEGDDESTKITWVLLHHTGWADQTRPKEAQQIAGGLDQIYGMATPQAFNAIAREREKVPANSDENLVVLWAYKQRNMDKGSWERLVLRPVVPHPIPGSTF